MQPLSPIHILVVEDNLVVSDSIKRMLSTLTYELTEVVVDFESAVVALATKPIDLVLIDIVLATDKTGIDLGSHIRSTYDIPFIFITSNSDKVTVSEAKLVKPNGYLVKPFQKQDLFTAIEIALFNFQDHESRNELKASKTVYKKLPEGILTDSIFIKKQHIYRRIAFNDIQYIKSDNVYLEVYTTTQCFLVRSTLKDYLNKLPPQTFHRAHKSYIVNINHIEALNTRDVVVAEKTIPISKDFKDYLIRSMNS